MSQILLGNDMEGNFHLLILWECLPLQAIGSEENNKNQNAELGPKL